MSKSAPAGSEHRPHGESPQDSVAAGHELSDVSSKDLLVFVVVLFAALVVIHFALSYQYGYYVKLADRNDPPLSPLARDRSPVAGPHLQDNPTHDLAEFRKRQRQGLKEYRWIDKKEGIVELPIERAMELTVERGLPIPEQPVPNQPAPETKSSPEAKSGDDKNTEQRQP